MGRVGFRRLRGMGLRLLIGLGALLLAGVLPLSLASAPEARPEPSARATAAADAALLDHPPWEPPPLPAWRDPQLEGPRVASGEQPRGDADLIGRRAPAPTLTPIGTPTPALVVRPPATVPPSPNASRPAEPGGAAAMGTWQWPLVGALSSLFGPAHPLGIDIAADPGLPVGAARAGRVAHVAYDERGYGHFLLLHHEEGFSTLYGHLREPPLVAAGAVVQPGQTLGAVGSTGNSTGPHLHFELRRHDRLLDPLPILPSMALVLGPEATRTPLPTPASTPTPTASPIASASATPTATATPALAAIPTDTPGPCPTPTRPPMTPTSTAAGRSGSSTPSATATPALTSTRTPTPTMAAAAGTAVAGPAVTPTVPVTPAPTATPSGTAPRCDDPPPARATPTVGPGRAELGRAIVHEPDGVNLRAGPGLDFAVLLALPKGMPLTVTSAADDSGWLAVRAGEREGWVRAEYVEWSVEAEAMPVGKGTPAPTATQPVTATAARTRTPTATATASVTGAGTPGPPCATTAPSATPAARLPVPSTAPSAQPPTSVATPPPCGRPLPS